MRAVLVSFIALASAAWGCSKSAPPPGKGVAIGSVCSEPDKSRVRLDGFVRYRRGLMSFCSSYGGKKTCDLALYESAERPADFDVMRPRTGPEPVTARLSVPVGDAPGEMDDLPKKFQDQDVKVHLAGGATAGEGARVVVDGTVNAIPADPSKPNEPKSCYVTVEWAAAG